MKYVFCLLQSVEPLAIFVQVILQVPAAVMDAPQPCLEHHDLPVYQPVGLPIVGFLLDQVWKVLCAGPVARPLVCFDDCIFVNPFVQKSGKLVPACILDHFCITPMDTKAIGLNHNGHQRFFFVASANLALLRAAHEKFVCLYLSLQRMLARTGHGGANRLLEVPTGMLAQIQCLDSS